jgi:hypothetical protein
MLLERTDSAARDPPDLIGLDAHKRHNHLGLFSFRGCSCLEDPCEVCPRPRWLRTHCAWCDRTPERIGNVCGRTLFCGPAQTSLCKWLFFQKYSGLWRDRWHYDWELFLVVNGVQLFIPAFELRDD